MINTCFRAANGKLHLVPDIGKVPLADALLLEDPSESQGNDDGIKRLHI